MKIKYFGIIVILAIAIFCFGSTAGVRATIDCMSYSTDNDKISCLTSLIAQLTQQITQLRTLQGQCSTFNAYLYTGATDATTNGGVSNLRAILAREGFNSTGDGAGVFGNATAAAVVAFQQKHGITKTGTVGPKTRSELNTLYGCVPISTPLPLPSPTPTPTSVPNAATCTDSDNGREYGLRGTISGVEDVATGSTGMHTDVCDDAVWLKEYYCSGQVGSVVSGQTINNNNGFIREYRIACPYGCLNGACRPASSVGPLITVLSPNGDEKITKGSDIVVRWTSQGVDRVFIQAQYYDSNGTVDSANAINNTICRLTADSISAASGTFTIAGGNTGRCGVLPEGARIKMLVSGATSSGVAVSDESNNYFSIVVPSTRPTLKVTLPNGGEPWIVGATQNITWSSAFLPQGALLTIGAIDYSNGVKHYDIATNVNSDLGSYSWKIPATITPGGSSFKIEITYNANVNGFASDVSDNFFSITNSASPARIMVTSPVGGVRLAQGSTRNITWNPAGLTNVTIDVVNYLSSGGTYRIATDIPGSSGSFTWTVGSTTTSGQTIPPGQYKVLISDMTNLAVSDSNYYFSIDAAQTTPSSVRVTSPNGRETWMAGETHNITWQSSGVSDVKIIAYYYPFNSTAYGGAHYTIATVPASSGSYSWRVGDNSERLTMAPGQYKIQVGDSNNPSVMDLSDDYFGINMSIGVQGSWKTGEIQNITWHPGPAVNASIVALYYPYLSSEVKQYKIADVVASSGSYSWTVGNNMEKSVMPTGKYNIFICHVYDDGTPASCYGTVRFDIVNITTPAPSLKVYSADIINSQAAYGPGQATVFNVGGVASDGTIGSPEKGFGVSYVLKDNGTVYRSGAAVYNSSTGYWDISTTVSSDTTKTHTAEIFFSCLTYQNSDSKCVSGSINKSFSFTISASGQALRGISILSPGEGVRWKPGETHNITWQTTGLSASDRVNISLIGTIIIGTQNHYTLNITPTGGVSALDGAYSWTIPSDIQADVATDTIKIECPGITSGSGVLSAVSRYFTIDPASTAFCNDSDGGVNYSTAGTITTDAYGWSSSISDTCKAYTSGGLYQDVNSCTGTSCWIQEYSCSGSAPIRNTTVNCPNGCSNGACNSAVSFRENASNQSLSSLYDAFIDMIARMRGANN
jgi:hypothetical protein